MTRQDQYSYARQRIAPFTHFKAMVYVRVVRKFREPGAVIVQVVLPIIYMVVGLALTNITDFENKQVCAIT